VRAITKTTVRPEARSTRATRKPVRARSGYTTQPASRIPHREARTAATMVKAERATVPIHSAEPGATSAATETSVAAATMPLMTSSAVSGSRCTQPDVFNLRAKSTTSVVITVRKSQEGNDHCDSAWHCIETGSTADITYGFRSHSARNPRRDKQHRRMCAQSHPIPVATRSGGDQRQHRPHHRACQTNRSGETEQNEGQTKR